MKKTYVAIIIVLVIIIGAGTYMTLTKIDPNTDTSSELSTGTNFDTLHQQLGEESPVSKVEKGMPKSDVDELLGVAVDEGLSSQGYQTFSYLVDIYKVYVFYDNDSVIEMSVTEV